MKKKSIRCTDAEAARLCLELSLFIRSGMDLGTGLQLIGEKMPKSPLSDAVMQLSRTLFDGVPLSIAIAESGLFPDDAAAMIGIGETTGRLEEAVTSLAEFYKNRDDTAARIRSAVLYPSVLFAVMLGVIVLLLTKVLPIFSKVYASFGGSMTGAAAFLLNSGTLLQAVLPIVAILLLLSVPVIVLLTKRGAFDYIRQNDRIYIAYRTAQFAQALSMGIASGLSPSESVEEAGKLLKQENRTAQCLTHLDNGLSLADALEKTELLPLAECRLLSLALLSGNGEEISRKIARQLQQQADAALDKRLSLIEPALVLTASLLVGVILLSVMVPLTGLMSAMG